jgi:hypothetical protein
MKADDIRTLNERMQEQMLNSKSVEGQDAGFKSLLLSLLSEMAAQGAESNENLRRVLNPPLMYDTSNIDPSDWPDLPQPVHFTVREKRATLRDQFAMAAMQALLAGKSALDRNQLAIDAYFYAEGMMEARKK